MPTQAALDIVNALFSGKKDVSDYVATGMKDAAVDSIDARKAEVGKTILAPEPPEVEEPEAEEQPETPQASTETETEVTPEESKDETDQGGN